MPAPSVCTVADNLLTMLYAFFVVTECEVNPTETYNINSKKYPISTVWLSE